MSLADLTRNSFQSGIPAAKESSSWTSLCRLFLSKQPQHTVEDSERAISNSVLILFSSYPGDPALQGYLKGAIQQGLISLSMFVTTFLQAARSPELHNPATLDTLCRIAIDAHFASGLSSLNTVISFPEGPDIVLATIRDALVLLRTAYTLPISHFHRLLESVGELVIILLNSFTDVSKASSAQAKACVDDAKAVLQLFALNTSVRRTLEKFVVSLSRFADEDPTAARQVQGMHKMHSSLTKGDVLAPGSETDIISCSFILYHLVLDRPRDYGAGNGANATAILVSTFRASSWPLAKFYVQLFFSAITCLSQDLSPVPRKRNLSLWRAFVIGRLPYLLVSFEKALEAEGVSATDIHAAIRDAWGSICSGQPPLLVQYETALAMVSGQDQMGESPDRAPSFTRSFTQQLLSVGLIDQAFAARIDFSLASDYSSRLQSEAREAGVGLEIYLGYKLAPENTADDNEAFIERIYADFTCHANFAEIIRKRFTTLSANLDLDTLSHLARMLYNNEFALDIVSLHVKLSDLVAHALAVLEDYDCEIVGDPQTAVTHLGDMVVFLQLTATRYNLMHGPEHLGNRSLDPSFLRTASLLQRVNTFTAERRANFALWFKAIFDKNSEGIEDSILRTTSPKTLLATAATLCYSAILACAEHKIDYEVLNNGMTYFLGPLLNWTLLGIVQAILRGVRITKFQSPQHLLVLRTLLLSPSFPKPTLRMCGLSVLRLLSEPSLQRFIPEALNAPAIRKVVYQALGWPEEGPTRPSSSINSPTTFPDPTHHAIRNAITQIQQGKASTFDVSACLHTTPPTPFLQLLWSQVSAATGVEISLDAAKRFVVFILATPRTPRTPPLLPIFLHNIFPALIDAVDEDKGSQSMQAELLVMIVSSSVTTALHLERAVLVTSDKRRYPLGEPSIAMARQLAADLRHRKQSTTAKLIAERLASSATFVANFPVFKTEI